MSEAEALERLNALYDRIKAGQFVSEQTLKRATDEWVRLVRARIGDTPGGDNHSHRLGYVNPGGKGKARKQA